MTSDPDILIHDITEEDEFFVMACDGTMIQSVSTYTVLIYGSRYLGLYDIPGHCELG